LLLADANFDVAFTYRFLDDKIISCNLFLFDALKQATLTADLLAE